MSTYMPKAADIERKWYVLDAEGKPLGRVAAVAADLLRGKRKTTFVPHLDCGDHVIVINAEKIRVTGKKETDKEYMFYTGYVGGEKYVSLSEFRKRKPEFIIENAVRGMMPKNKLASAMLKKLHVYAGAEHPHAAQQPKPFNF